jgi:hypothetical protein
MSGAQAEPLKANSEASGADKTSRVAARPIGVIAGKLSTILFPYIWTTFQLIVILSAQNEKLWGKLSTYYIFTYHFPLIMILSEKYGEQAKAPLQPEIQIG